MSYPPLPSSMLSHGVDTRMGVRRDRKSVEVVAWGLRLADGNTVKSGNDTRPFGCWNSLELEPMNEPVQPSNMTKKEER
jgi:hypothetical protein